MDYTTDDWVVVSSEHLKFDLDLGFLVALLSPNHSHHSAVRFIIYSRKRDTTRYVFTDRIQDKDGGLRLEYSDIAND